MLLDVPRVAEPVLVCLGMMKRRIGLDGWSGRVRVYAMLNDEKGLKIHVCHHVKEFLFMFGCHRHAIARVALVSS